MLKCEIQVSIIVHLNLFYQHSKLVLESITSSLSSLPHSPPSLSSHPLYPPVAFSPLPRYRVHLFEIEDLHLPVLDFDQTLFLEFLEDTAHRFFGHAGEFG